jgi:hypothetical protein
MLTVFNHARNTLADDEGRLAVRSHTSLGERSIYTAAPSVRGLENARGNHSGAADYNTKAR